MTAALLAGSGIGIATYLVLRAITPSVRPLATTIDDLTRSRAPIAVVGRDGATSPTRLSERIGQLLVDAAAGARVDLSGRAGDLAIVDRSLERHVFEKVCLAAYGLVLPFVVWTLTGLAGVALPWPLLVAAAAGLAVAGFVTPDLTLRSAIEQRRASLRHALGVFLDLASVILAGGAGTETALYEAAEAGESWGARQIRQALAACRLSGTTPWDGLGRLGVRLGVAELGELAASVGLAGEHGAKVRTSLAAKAASLREHELAEAEAEAQSASERMTLPLVMLLFGFVVLVGYPAVERVLTSL